MAKPTTSNEICLAKRERPSPTKKDSPRTASELGVLTSHVFKTMYPPERVALETDNSMQSSGLRKLPDPREAPLAARISFSLKPRKQDAAYAIPRMAID